MASSHHRTITRRWFRVDWLLLVLTGLAVMLGLQLYGGSGGEGEPPEVLPAPYGEETLAAAGAAPNEPLPVEGMPESGEPVRFLMLNVENYFVAGEQQRSRYVNRPKPEAARDAVADVIAAAEPDIVGLVEMGGPLALDDLCRRLQERGLEYAHRRVLTRGGEDRALALLSRYPVVQDSSRANCRLFGQQRRMMLRGILDVVVRVDDGRLFRVMGAHLKSRVGDDDAAAASLREREAQTLAHHIREAVQAQPLLPLVVYGDWNDSPADASVRLLVQGVSGQSSLKRLNPKDSRGEEWTLYYQREHAYSTFDHLFVNSVLRKRMKKSAACGIIDTPESRRASDHRALWCELR